MQWKSNGLSPYMMAKVVYYSLCEKCPYSEIFWTVFSGTGLNMKRLMLYRVLNYMLKVTDRSTRKRCEIWSKLTIKTPEQRQWYQPDIQIYWHLLICLFLFAIRMWGFFLENCLRHLNVKMIFYIRVFFRRHWQFTGQHEKRGNHLIFLRHLFATLHVRWLPSIFSCKACSY